jgi:flagellar basal-body rod protein FlgF
MDTSLYVNLSRQTAVSRQLEVVANNLANVTTTGFRAERAVFDEALRKAGKSDEVAYVIDRATYTDHQPGAMIQTDNPLDLAIKGKGFFQVETPEGPRYTRDGRMALSPTGDLVSIDGRPFMSAQGAPIQLPPEASEILIANDGTVSADGVDLGRIGVFAFDDELSLRREEAGRFAAPVPPAAVENPAVQQGMIEGSNVDPITEITRLIDLSRAYEQAAKMSNDIHDQKKDAVRRLGSIR